MDFIKDINHRMDLIEKADKEINLEYKELNTDISSLKTKTILELQELKKECKSMLEECKTIHKAVYKLGATLREKTPHSKLDELKKSMDEWKIEDFARREDIINSFERYAR
jgi:tRNA U54 and U55 pseudouridine synthase Pus10